MSDAAGIPTALLGTVVYRTGLGSRSAGLTTPSAPELQALLAEAAGAGDQAAVVEVSSHALDQERVRGLRFATGVFTNLYPDHLDYHTSVEEYFEAKRRLFAGPLACARAVVGIDGKHGQRIAAKRPDADRGVDAVRQQPTGSFVPEVVPAEIDPLKLLTIPRGARPRRSRLDAMREESKCFPGRLEFGLIRAVRCSERVRVGPELRSTLEDGGEPSFWIERNAPVFLVLGSRTRNPDLVRLPVHALVLNQQHLAAPTTQFQRADDPVVQQWSDELMFGRVHPLQRRAEQFLFLLSE